jgi:hypothetical protein
LALAVKLVDVFVGALAPQLQLTIARVIFD